MPLQSVVVADTVAVVARVRGAWCRRQLRVRPHTSAWCRRRWCVLLALEFGSSRVVCCSSHFDSKTGFRVGSGQPKTTQSHFGKIFRKKWDEQHAAHELPNSSASTTRTPARARARAAPSTQHPASTSDDEQRTATVTVTAAATTTDCGGIRFCFFWFSFFFAPGSVFFSV